MRFDRSSKVEVNVVLSLGKTVCTFDRRLFDSKTDANFADVIADIPYHIEPPQRRRLVAAGSSLISISAANPHDTNLLRKCLSCSRRSAASSVLRARERRYEAGSG